MLFLLAIPRSLYVRILLQELLPSPLRFYVSYWKYPRKSIFVLRLVRLPADFAQDRCQKAGGSLAYCGLDLPTCLRLIRQPADFAQDRCQKAGGSLAYCGLDLPTCLRLIRLTADSLRTVSEGRRFLGYCGLDLPTCLRLARLCTSRNSCFVQ